MACERCAQLRKQAKEQARKLQLKRLAQTAAEAARVALSKKDDGDAK